MTIHTEVEHAGHVYPAGAVCGGKLLICETKQLVWMISKISQEENIKLCKKTKKKIKLKNGRKEAITKSDKSHTEAAQSCCLRISPHLDCCLTKATCWRPIIFSIYHPFRVRTNLG